MTQVDFHFITPTGDPIQEGFVEITLSESAWLQIESGVVLPRIVFGYTDLEGRISFDLWPVKTAEYTVTVTDTHQDNEVVTKHYFFVPRSDVPVRLQDILMEPEPTPKPYDEASIEAIQQNRIQAQWARDETDSLHEQVIVREANVADMQADVTVRQADVKVMQDQVTVLRDTTLVSQQAAETAEDNAETAQAAAEAALADAVNEAVKAATARVGAEAARSATETLQASTANLEQLAKQHKEAAHNSALAAESFYGLHADRSDNPHGVTKAQVGLDLVDNVAAVSLRDRATHTGNQAIATILGLQAALDDKVDSLHKSSGDHDARYYTKTEVDDRYSAFVQHNFAGITAPTVDHDSSVGYSRSSLWYDNETGEAYQCFDATDGAAVWIKVTLTEDEFGSAAFVPVETFDPAGSAAAAETAAKAYTDTHEGRLDNPHGVTKAQVGLGSVDDVSAAALRDRSTHTGTQTLATLSDAGTAAAQDVEAFEPAGSVASHEAALDPHTQYVQKEAGKGLSSTDYTQLEKDKLAGVEDGAQVNVVDSVAGKTGAVTLAKADVGLGSVDNTSDAAKPVSTAQQTALDAKIDSTEKGAANGVATLDASGQVPAAQLPSYVDDVLEVDPLPASGETGKLYLRTSDNTVHRWSGSAWIEISASAGTVDAAHKLATARSIALTGDATGSIPFDGTADVSIPVTVADDSHNHIIDNVDGLQTALDAKVDVVIGMGLSANDYTDAEKTKLGGIEAGATADQTKTDIDALGIDAATVDGLTVATSVPAGAVFTDTVYDDTEVQTALTNKVDKVTGKQLSTEDYTSAEKTKLTGIEEAATADQTGAEIKLAYEGELDTNAFTDAEKSKLTGVAEGATANSSDATLLDRTNHTGTQTLATISDAGTSAGLDVPATGDAAVGEVVKGDDSRLSDSRAPTAHGHALADVSDAGTSAGLNVAATGDAAAGEVVKGDDTRLSDARAPTAHNHTLAEISDAGTAAGSAIEDFEAAGTVSTHEGAADPHSQYAQPTQANTWTGEQTLTEYKETVNALSGNALDPANGTIQTLALSGAVTLSDALESGQTMLLDLSGADVHTVTWPALTWVGGAVPTFTARDHLQIYKIGSTLFGAYVGSVA